MYSFKGWQKNENHGFPSKRCVNNDNTLLLHICTMQIICTYLYINCNKKILFVKNILSYCGYSSTSPFFLLLSEHKQCDDAANRTASTLEAEFRQVCGEACVRWQRKSQVLGAFGLLDFTMLRPVLAWRAFWKWWPVYFIIFQIFFGPRQTADMGVRLYFVSKNAIWLEQ